MKKHLNLEGRSFIASSLKLGMSLGEIAKELGVSTSTVSREIKKHRQVSHKSCRRYCLNNCAKQKDCTKTGICEDKPNCVTKRCVFCNRCNSNCPDFKRIECPKLSKPPYVCNGCEYLDSCRLDKCLYYASTADIEYRTLLKDRRSGFNMTDEEVMYVDKIATPLLKNGQSPYVVVRNNKNTIRCSASTLYRLVNSCVIGARAIDLQRTVRFKPRKSASAGAKVDRNCRIGRTYEDYVRFREANQDISFSQMDSVEGKRGGAVLLTVELETVNFMLGFIREHNNAQSVIDVFNCLYDLLPRKVYYSMFGHLLTDNGSEFSNPLAIEFAETTNVKRSSVFYCNPAAPFQKGKVENNHGLLRNIFPKGASLNGFTQQDINLAMSHLNSYRRGKFNWLSPAELFVQMYGEDVLRLLGQSVIPPNEVVLKPTLLQK